MGPGAGGAPSGTLADKINDAFGSFDDFKTQFGASAAGVFGSGWAWLAVAGDGSVKIVTTPNQARPRAPPNSHNPRVQAKRAVPARPLVRPPLAPCWPLG